MTIKTTIISYLALICLGYLVGSIANSILVAKLLRLQDPRTMGSKNPGATNMLRLAGKKWGVIVLLLDVFKGILPVYFAVFLSTPAWVVAAVAGAAFLGHLYPLYFYFKGGKGVATSLGIILVLSWQVLLCLLAVWIIVLVVSRYVSLASIVSSIAFPVFIYYWHLPWPSYLILALLMMSLIVWRHRSNALRIIKGAEPKLF